MTARADRVIAFEECGEEVGECLYRSDYALAKVSGEDPPGEKEEEGEGPLGAWCEVTGPEEGEGERRAWEPDEEAEEGDAGLVTDTISAATRVLWLLRLRRSDASLHLADRLTWLARAHPIIPRCRSHTARSCGRVRSD